MKLFKKKEEKNKVGRPKLADNPTKKKSIIMCGISFLLILTLLAGGLVSFNILPNFNRLKGAVNTSLCSEVPARFQPYDAVNNPEGLHEYGFTDPKFYSAVVSTYNEDSLYCDVITEEQLNGITSLEAASSELDNVDGIQYLTGLTSLNLSSNNLEEIDLSNNHEIVSLNIYYNSNLKSLNLSGNTKLTSFDWGYVDGVSRLETIDVSGMTALTELYLPNNNLSSIDLSGNSALKTLNLENNNLSSIDLSNNTELTSLYLSNNNLEEIDVSSNTALTSLRLSSNNLTSIDLSSNSALTTLELYNNNLETIDVSGMTSLTNLYISGNNLTSIDVSNNKNLIELELQSNNLNSIDVSNNIALERLLLGNNNLNDINVDNNTSLIWLYLHNNNLSSVDVSNNTNLGWLSLSGNPFEKTYFSTDKTIAIEQPNIITAYPNDITYSIGDKNIATYNDGIVEKRMAGSTKLTIKYKISDSSTCDISYNINFIGVKSNYYVINYSDKTINLKGSILSSVPISKFSSAVDGYNLAINNDELEIKDVDENVVDTYKFINYKLFNLTSSYYTINEEEKMVDLNGEILSNVSTSKFSLSPSNNTLNINNDKLNIKDSEGNIIDTYTFTNYILYKLTSTNYPIDEENKTINLNGAILSNIYDSHFSITPLSYTKNINENKLEIKDSGENVVDTYKFINYKLFNLTSSYYTINEEEKTIDLNKDILSNINTWKFGITPSTYKLVINKDKLEIKDSNESIIETYDFINYSKYKLTSSYYTINEEEKIIDANDKIFVKNKIWINPSNLYQININENRLEILDSEKNVINSYEIINMRSKDENAYLKAGFKDKSLYTCVVRNFTNNEEIDGNYLLTDDEMNTINYFECINKNVLDASGIEKLTKLKELNLSYNNITSINLKKNKNLYSLVMINNKLTNLDVTNNISLETIWVPNNNISKINGLNNLDSLITLFAYNNDISSLNLNKSANIELIVVDKNNVSNTLYLLKGTSLDYKDDIKLNGKYEIDYDVDDLDVVSYKDRVLKAKNEGITTVYLSNEYIYGYRFDAYDKAFKCEYLNDEESCLVIEELEEQDVLLPYFLSQEIKVYDIKSSEYEIDKTKKTIDALNKDFDTNKINLTLKGLSGIVDGNKFIIKDGDKTVDEYTINNVKQVVNNETLSNSSNGTKVKTNKNLISDIQDRKENVELDDIYINSNIIPITTLMLIKGKDRNIIVKQNDVTFTINGKDVEKINGNLDLSYELNVLKESSMYNEIKDNVSSGMVLSFKNSNDLPGKVLIEIEQTDKIKKNIGIKNINVYGYKEGKLTLVAENLSSYDNKISLYVDKLGNYVLTSNKIEDKKVEIDDSMMGENTKLTKKINLKRLIIPIIILIILIVLGIIGYVRYKKEKKT